MSKNISITDQAVTEHLPVITIVELRPKVPLQSEALESFNGIIRAAAKFKGYQEADVFKKIKEDGATEYAIILRFNSYSNLQVWNNSPVRKQYIASSRHFFEEVKPELALTGLDFWFQSKQTNVAKAPPKWKMLLVTVVIIFVMLNAVMPFIGKLLGYIGLPGLFNTLIGVIIMVSMMTYLIMPAVTGLLHGWLFKIKKPSTLNQ